MMFEIFGLEKAMEIYNNSKEEYTNICDMLSIINQDMTIPRIREPEERRKYETFIEELKKVYKKVIHMSFY